MWISKTEYRELIERAARAESVAQGFAEKLNTLARENAELKHEKTGRAQTLPIFQYQREATPKVAPDAQTGITFDDMGDEQAHLHGFTEE